MKKNHVIIGIGEILWDLLPDGKVFGGAPANFAYHARQLGGTSSVISAVGDDDLGREIKEVMKQKQLDDCLHTSPLPTGTVGVNLDENGIPCYTIHENVAWDDIHLSNHAIDKLRWADALCYGSLAQRGAISRRAVQDALTLASMHCMKVFDINLRQNWYEPENIRQCIRRSDVLKINDEELVIVARMLGYRGTEENMCGCLMNQNGLQLLVLTKGSNGSILLTHSEKSYMESPKVEVVDTVGAGDAFTAAVVMGRLEGMPLKEIHRRAVAISAFVCTQKGATPQIPDHMKG